MSKAEEWEIRGRGAMACYQKRNGTQVNKTADKRLDGGMNMKQNLKKWLAGFLVLALACSGSGCGKEAQNTKQEKNQTESTDVDMQDTKLKADISFWSFQIGTWGDETAVQSVIKKFNEKYPNIHVTYQALDYETGDTVVADALEKRKDLILLWKDRNDW